MKTLFRALTSHLSPWTPLKWGHSPSRLLFTCLFALCVAGGLSSCSKAIVYKETPRRFVPAMEAINMAYSLELEALHGIYLRDSEIIYDEHIEISRLFFRSQRILDVPQTRDLIVDVVEGYLQRLNANPQLPTLFTPENLYIAIEFESYAIKYLDTSYVARILLQNGYVYYYDFDAINCVQDDPCFLRKCEPYAQALHLSQVTNRTLYGDADERWPCHQGEPKSTYTPESGAMR